MESSYRRPRVGDLPPELVAALKQVPIGIAVQDRSVIDLLARNFDWPYPDDPFTMAARLCDEDGTVRGGPMHHGTDYPCTAHAHFAGEHIICSTPVHFMGSDQEAEGA
jgi:hypothetical protein